MAYSIPRKGQSERYRIMTRFYDNVAGTWKKGQAVEWSEEWSGWHMAAGVVSAPCGYTKVRVSVDYCNNCNTAYFDGMFLHKEEFGQSYSYDSKGNLISQKGLTALQDAATYDAFNNMTSYRQPGRPDTVKTQLNYGGSDAERKKHLLHSITTPLCATARPMV